MKYTKQSLRIKLQNFRKNLSIIYRSHASHLLCASLVKLKVFLQAKSLAAYWPHNGEISPLPLLHYANTLNKSCYLPVLDPNGKKELIFATYQSFDNLVLNKYGILEPDIRYTATIELQNLSLMLLPLLGFDKYGNRLGLGQGYYDATLSALNKHQKRPFTIGLGYDEQEVTEIPIDSWDYRLDAIITEKKQIILNNNII